MELLVSCCVHEASNGGVDRATALPSSFAGSRLMRNSLPVAPVQRFVRRPVVKTRSLEKPRRQTAFGRSLIRYPRACLCQRKELQSRPRGEDKGSVLTMRSLAIRCQNRVIENCTDEADKSSFEYRPDKGTG